MKGATKAIIREEAEKHTGRRMTNKAAKKWLRKQPHLKAVVDRSFRWPQAPTLPTIYRGMAAMVRKENMVPFGWGRLEQPGMAEAIQMPLWFWWSVCAVNWIRSAPARGFLWMVGIRRDR